MSGGATDERAGARATAFDWLLRLETLTAFAYGWLYYPISQHFTGDFLAMLTHRDNGRSDWSGHGYGYGPVFVLYELLLQPFHDRVALWLMFVVNLFLLALTFALLMKTFLPRERSPRLWTLALFAWINFYPLVQLVRQDNVEITELFCLTAFVYALARGRELRSGAWLGMAISAKLVPLCLVPYLVWRRKWRAALVALAVFVAMLLAVARIKGFDPIAGMDTWRDATTGVFINSWNNNQGFSGFFLRLFGVASFGDPMAMSHPHVLYPRLGSALATAGELLLVATTIFVFVRRSGWWPRSTRPALLTIEPVIIVSVVLLGAPLAHTHYFGLITSTYFIALWAVARTSFADERVVFWFLLSYLLLGLLMPLRAFDPIAARFMPSSFIELWKLLSVPFCGVLVALLALFAVHGAVAKDAAR